MKNQKQKGSSTPSWKVSINKILVSGKVRECDLSKISGTIYCKIKLELTLSNKACLIACIGVGDIAKKLSLIARKGNELLIDGRFTRIAIDTQILIINAVLLKDNSKLFSKNLDLVNDLEPENL